MSAIVRRGRRRQSYAANFEAMVLRKMGEKKVPGEYIDAFIGRVPKTARARHYSDYTPENLRKIYEEAGLKVLD